MSGLVIAAPTTRTRSQTGWYNMPEKKKFKIGEVVIGNSEANKHYGITRTGWVGRVEGLSAGGKGMRVASLANGRGFNVEIAHFDLYDGYAEGSVINIWEGLKQKG